MIQTMECLNRRVERLARGVMDLVRNTNCYYLEFSGAKVSFCWNDGSNILIYFGAGKK